MVRRPLFALRQPWSERRPVDRPDYEAAVAGRANYLTELGQPPGLAVRGERHDLVLIGGAAEAEVNGRLFVHEAQGVGQPLGGEELELPVCAVAPGEVRRTLAASVEDEDARGREGRREVCRGGVRDVVRDEAHLRRVEAG